MLFYSTIKLRWISVKRSTVFQICEKLLFPCPHISSCVFCATLLFSSLKIHYGKKIVLFQKKILEGKFISGSIHFSKMVVVLRNKIKVNWCNSLKTDSMWLNVRIMSTFFFWEESSINQLIADKKILHNTLISSQSFYSTFFSTATKKNFYCD